MKRLFCLVSIVLMSEFSYGNPTNCADLSFKMNGGLVEFRQVQCERFHITVFDFSGNILWEKETFFADKFETVDADDAVERYTSQQRWMWSRDGQKLIHEAIFDKLVKENSDRVFDSVTEIISLGNNNKIERKKSQILRVEKLDGNVTIETRTDTRAFDRM